MTLLKINKHIQEIKSKLLMKDTKIDLLNTEVKTAYTIIHSLQQRINELELQKKIQDEQMEVTEHVATPPRCFLLRDTNTRRVHRSDLHNTCSVKTIERANMDLLKSLVNEQLKNNTERV